MNADVAVDFPEIELVNLKYIGPVFTTGSGSMSIALQGYVVSTS